MLLGLQSLFLNNIPKLLKLIFNKYNRFNTKTALKNFD